MAEEFQESEVIFQESFNDEDRTNYDVSNGNFPMSGRESRNSKGKRRKSMAVNRNRSVPVSIPVNATRNRWFRCVDADLDDGDGGEMVPPHVIIGRRVAGKMMALSICTGNGRILKGKDLSEFRNLILRMTGFLET